MMFPVPKIPLWREEEEFEVNSSKSHTNWKQDTRNWKIVIRVRNENRFLSWKVDSLIIIEDDNDKTNEENNDESIVSIFKQITFSFEFLDHQTWMKIIKIKFNCVLDPQKLLLRCYAIEVKTERGSEMCSSSSLSLTQPKTFNPNLTGKRSRTKNIFIWFLSNVCRWVKTVFSRLSFSEPSTQAICSVCFSWNVQHIVK